MAEPPSPSDIFHRAAEEGKRRLDQSLVELVSTGFIAGFMIVFGIVAFALVYSLTEPQLGAVAKITGSLAFGIGVVFLIVGRAELFSENIFDPVATAIDEPESWSVSLLLRLWIVTLVFNLLGGVIFLLVFSVEGVLITRATATVRDIAIETAAQRTTTTFASAIAGGALVTLLSFLLSALDTSGGRLAVAYATGFLLELGPFDHVIVTTLYLLFGALFGVPIESSTILVTMVVLTAGNLVGGLGLVTFAHIERATGAD